MNRTNFIKKSLTTFALGALLATTAHADFARVELGGGMWTQAPSGILSYTESGATGEYNSEKKSNTGAYAWLLVKHPLPIVPNLRVEYASMKDVGKASGNFHGFTAPADSDASLEITEFDVIPYYNILDNTFWITVDLGVDFKVTNITYKASGVNVPLVGASTDYEDSTSIVIPLGYVRARVEIPATDIGLEADVKYISYDDSTVSDMRVKVDYTLGFIPVIQPAIEIGYRVHKIDVKTDDKKTNMNVDFAGVYAGLMLRF